MTVHLCFYCFVCFTFDAVQKASKNWIQSEIYYSRTELVMARKICSTKKNTIKNRKKRLYLISTLVDDPFSLPFNHACQREIALNKPASLFKAFFCLLSYSEVIS